MEKQYQGIEELIEKGLIWQQARSRKGGRLFTEVKTPLARFSIPEIDSALPASGLPFAALHEFVLQNSTTSKNKNSWTPPLLIIAYLLSNALKVKSTESQDKAFFAWIGEKIWPTPQLLQKAGFAQESNLPISNSLFISTETKQERLLALSETLRSPSVYAVIADGSGLSFTQTRSLQCSVKEGGALCFLLRPPWELLKTSAAQTRWKLENKREESKENGELSWELTLVSAKGSISTPCISTPRVETEEISSKKEIYWPRSWDISLKDLSGHKLNIIEKRGKSDGQDTLRLVS